MSKKANLYKITAKFKDGHNWDLKVVAINMLWCTTFIDSHNGKEIIDFHIELLQEDYAEVKENYGLSD
jgi:hypothetical protein